MRDLRRVLIALLLGTLLWIPALHTLFEDDADPQGRARTQRLLMRRQLALFDDPSARSRELTRMRGANAEWDFMGRTFTVLSLANHALDVPKDRSRSLAAIDVLLEETLRLEAERGQAHFMMAYVHRGPFRDPSGRSVFVDGEIALMLAARQRVRVSPRWQAPLTQRVAQISRQLERGPAMSAESYPDECWTFCNTVALAALQVSDSVTGEEHGPLLRAWLAHAREHLIDRQTGLLVSSFRYDGTPLDGPEGSSIFLAAHMLELVDAEFAREQYRLARRHLGVSALGFGWAREWPASWRGPTDVDSGPIVPLVDASAGASGMALLGAAAFHDEAWLSALHTSLAFAAFPIEEDGTLRFAASNQVGDAVLLYSLTQGPLWRQVGARQDSDAVALGGG